MMLEGLRTPANGTQVPAGQVLFSWDPVPSADMYVLFLGTAPLLTTDPSLWPYVDDLPGTIRVDAGNKASVAVDVPATAQRMYWRVDSFLRSFGRLGTIATFSFDVQQSSRGVPPPAPPPGDDQARTIMYVSGAVAAFGILWVLNSARKNTR